MPAESLLPLATYCALMSGTPGPNNVMLAASGANFGYRRTLPHMLGINIGAAVLTVVVCLGLGVVFQRFPALHGALKIVGALYLVWLAWKLAGASVQRGSAAATPLSFTEGAMFQVVNPKTWMKAATIATMFMPADFGALQGALLVAAIGIVVGFPLISVWALFGVAIGRFLGSPLALRVFNGAMGLALVVLAVSLVL
ncbi:LysE family translocator [Ramlibacter albus]|uniref:LysE family translocator n=1 Tax=Ramlibacter albus TaxID=2079448 RepID=A0A923MAM1_9BURK|nr:LysE family translocator [Ramlibacter albus]MBC5765819.1 LysE family translocator [Ramlibacter albus]